MKYSLEILILFFCIFLHVTGILFDRYSGKKVDEVLSKDLKSRNVFERCTIEARPCTPHEGRRIDGTCNNYKYPSKGAAGGPYLRLLKPEYGPSSDNNTRDIRKGKEDLPSARKVRRALQPTGRSEDNTFTIAAIHFLEFIGRDVSALNGELDFLKDRQHCCKPEGEHDARCIPIIVQTDSDDPLNVTDVRCLNLTRVETFQDAGCTNITPPEQVNRQTPVLDLSTIYGTDDISLDSVRQYKHGLLKLESRGGRPVPLDISISTANITDIKADVVRTLTSRDVCPQNTGNKTCYLFGFPEVANSDLRTTTLAIFFMREHNRIAKVLHEMHPCWTDDRLFKMSRQVNIATAANIFMYELLPAFLGYTNMVNFGLISDQVEHVTVYEKDEVPLVYAEYEIATKFFHTLLDGRIKRYDDNYRFVGEIFLGETLFEQGFIEQGKNFEEINRGTFYQKAAKMDNVQDPEVSEKYFGKLQKAHDLVAIDIQRGRDLGVRDYNHYRPICGLKAAKTFDEFLDVMDFEKVLTLQNLYANVNDVDLLAGIMAESPMKGTFVGPTLFCIMAKQLQLFRYSDRFWYERGDQVHSFSLEQVSEMRRANMARLACDNAEGIQSIQPRAFYNVGYGNMHVPCTHIPGPDLSKWQDSSCKSTQKPSEKKSTGREQDSPKVQQAQPPNIAMDYNAFLNSILSLRPTMKLSGLLV